MFEVTGLIASATLFVEISYTEVLTSHIPEGDNLSTTVWTLAIVLLILCNTVSTVDLPTSLPSMLQGVSGHTQTDQTLEVIGRLFHKLEFIATRVDFRLRV